jgi:serine protease Do
MAAKKSLYEILGVEPDANEMDISLAHQRRTYELKRIAQPDPNALGLVQQAFEILSNPKRRAAYDESLVTRSEQAAAAGQATDLVVEEGDEDDVRRKWLVPAIALAVVVVVAAFFVLRSGSSREKAAPAPVAEAPKPTPPPPPQPLRAEQILPTAMRASGLLLSYGMSGNAVPLGIAFSLDPGTVVTTCHGMAAGSKLVFRQGAETMSAELTVVDEDLDLCKLAVPGLAAKPLTVASEEPKAGDKVFVLGVNAKGDFALTEGIVKQVRAAGENRVVELSTPIAPTGSGGAVLDAFGKVIGVATTPHGFGPGVNAAISSASLPQMRSRERAK